MSLFRFGDYTFQKHAKFLFSKKVRLIELFGGIGSQAMALRDLGVSFEHHRLVEINPYSINSYNAIHNTHFSPSDITKLTGGDLGISPNDDYEYLLTYSYPCTSLSCAGKRDGMVEGSKTSSSLLWEVKRLLLETPRLPEVLLMENVVQCHQSLNRKEFDKWVDFLQSLGYHSEFCDIIATDFGVPQTRNRCFMVSILGEYAPYIFPKGEKNHGTFWEDIFDISSLDGDEYLIKNPKVIAKVDEVLKAQGDLYKDIIIGGKRIKENLWSSDARKFLSAGLNCTITMHSNTGSTPINTTMKVVLDETKEHGFELFKLSQLEEWRLMGYSDEDYYKAEKANIGRKRELYHQAGNAIVLQVLKAIFQQLFAPNEMENNIAG